MGFTDSYVRLLQASADRRAQTLRELAAIAAQARLQQAQTTATAQQQSGQAWAAVPGEVAKLATGAYDRYQQERRLALQEEMERRRVGVAGLQAQNESVRADTAARQADTAAAAEKSTAEDKLADNARATFIPLAPAYADAARKASQSPEDYARLRTALVTGMAHGQLAGFFPKDVQVPDTLTPETVPVLSQIADWLDKSFPGKPAESEPTVEVQTVDANGKPVTKVMPRSQAAGTYPAAPPKLDMSAQPGVSEDTKRPAFLATVPDPKSPTGTRLVPVPGATPTPPSAAVNVSGMNALYNAVDPKAIAKEIKEGRQSPIIADLGRPAAAAVSSELAKLGVDLSKMQSEWKSIQRFYLSKQSTQQLRIRQSADVILQSTDAIDALAKQWDAGGFKALNAATLAAAQHGLLGPEAAKIATQLQAQLTETVEAMGNVYMGGNTPTDRAMILAQQQLRANWSKDVLLASTDLVRRNTRFRLNAIDNIGPSGVNPESPYLLPRTETPTDVTPPPAHVAPAGVGGGAGPVTATAPKDKTQAWNSPNGVLHYDAKLGIWVK